MTIKLNTGDVVSFQLVGGGIVDTAFTNAKVLIGDSAYQAAVIIAPQLATRHYNLYPYFAPGDVSLDAPQKYNYVVLQLANGAIEVVGIPWITESSLNVIGMQTATIVITSFQNRFESTLRDTLNNLGASYTFDIV